MTDFPCFFKVCLPYFCGNGYCIIVALRYIIRIDYRHMSRDTDMYTKEVTVSNEVGLHARPATYFIQKANEFKSGIWVEKEERRVNAKSLLGVLSLGIVKGTVITLIADGSDEIAAVDALSELVEHQLGE